MTEQMPERGEPRDIEATGTIKDGEINIEASLGDARITLSWTVEESGADIDFLLAAAPNVAMQVMARLLEAQEADRG